MIRGALPADAHVLAGLATGRDGPGQQLHHRRVALVEAFGDQARIAVETERELRQVVRADREAVEMLEELLGQQGVGRQDRKSTRLNSSHVKISYADFCL